MANRIELSKATLSCPKKSNQLMLANASTSHYGIKRRNVQETKNVEHNWKQKKLKTPKSELKQTGRGNNYAYLALGESG